MILQTSFNDAIAEALERKSGFHYRHFIPREIIAMYRDEAKTHYPILLKVREFHMEAVEKLIERAGLDDNLFPKVVPVYSGKIDENGNVHIYKSRNTRERSGDIQIACSHAEHFMSTVIHDDWRQEMSSNVFAFERADLTALSDDMPYTTYGG